jgi:hypothetical protein
MSYSVRIYRQRKTAGADNPHLLIRRCEPVAGKTAHRIATGERAYKVAVPENDAAEVARHIAIALGAQS